MGGGGYSSGGSSDEYKEIIEETREKTKNVEYEARVNDRITEHLAESNARDAELTKEHLDELKEIVETDIGGTVDLRFGGSVSKHTYVEGLSDTDVLMLIEKTDLVDKNPQEVLKYIKSRLAEAHLRNVEDIRIGKLAVTVRYKDGTEIQLLPAVRKGDGYKIPSQKTGEWSNIIRPDKFASRLTEVNQSCNSKVIPVIKLVKRINSQLPEDQQLSGYHIESLAIEAFKSYPDSKEKTTKEMLKYFFEKAKNDVRSPIKDKTGQSIHVDDYLGAEDSRARMRISYTLDRVHRKMKNADELESIEEWDAILGE